MKNVFAILGFIILLGIGIWSAIQIITFVPRLFSTDGTVASDTTPTVVELGNKDVAVALSTETAQSGEPVRVSFAHSGGNTGTLSFSYACETGFYFQIDDNPIACNAPYTLALTDSILEVIPLTSKASIDATLAITYTNEAGESVRDTKTLTVVNPTGTEGVATTTAATNTTEAETARPTEATNTAATGAGPREPESVIPTTPIKTTAPQTYVVPQISNPYGVADLKVEMVAIGDINAYGVFEPKGIVHPYARAAAKFKVTNVGTKTSGTWYFSATLPTQGGYPFSSAAQPSLTPGSSIEIFMTFDQLLPGAQRFSVQIDPANYIYESNEYNNVTGQMLTVLNY